MTKGQPIHNPAWDRWQRKIGTVTVAVDDGLCVVVHTGGADTFTVTDVNELAKTLLAAREIRDGIETGQLANHAFRPEGDSVHCDWMPPWLENRGPCWRSREEHPS